MKSVLRGPSAANKERENLCNYFKLEAVNPTVKLRLSNLGLMASPFFK